MGEIIYVMTNQAMPGLVKIGKALKGLKRRVKDLSSPTGVPLPFEVHYACEVENAKTAEQSLHNGFGDHRINPKREFFRLDAERVVAILKGFGGKEIKVADSYVENKEEQQALNRERARAQKRFRFSLVKIEPGAELSFSRDENIKALVVDDRQVEFEGNVQSLSRAAQAVLAKYFDLNWESARGPVHWKYEGETLTERHSRLEDEALSDEES